MYFIWRNKPRSVLGHALNWIPGPEISKRLGEVGCFTSVDAAREYVRMHYPAGNVSVLNRKVFQQKNKTKKLPQFKPIEAAASGTDGPENGHLVYAEYLEKIVGKAAPGENTVTFPPANANETTGTEMIDSARHLLETVLNDVETLGEKELDLKDKIRQLDLVTSDRLHQAELCKLPDEMAPAFIAALRENLILRRRYKNELLAIQSAKEALDVLDAAAIKLGIQQIEGLGDQSYHCRVLTEKDVIVKATKLQRKE